MFKDLLRERRRSLAVRNLTDPAQSGGPVFDRFVNAAASAFMAPMAAISLICDGEQTVKAGHGFPIGCIARSKGFCSFTLDQAGVLECCDPLGDPRFAELPGVVGEPHVRYYIGAPLRLLSGIDVGALCVVDTVHRASASDDQKAYLAGLARQAALVLESRLDLWGHAA
ncbi:MAG: GAF domain-containing protein [Rhizorhabdus sp.]|jgi:GAF domain-containing protein